MKWSWKIATVAGINVYIHTTFLILIAWIALAYWQLAGTLLAVVSGVSFILALFFCVLLHEFGHALTARKFNIRTRNITLLPIGGIASIEKIPEDPREEIIIALAGPAVSFAIALLLWLLLTASDGLVSLEDLSITGGSFLQRLMLINILLAAFNLLPALPMDGGRVFRALMALWMEPVKATRIAAGVAQALAVVLALLTTFQVLEPHESLARAVELTLSGSQKDFPVVSDEGVTGVLRQSDLLRGLHDHGKLCRVDQVMQHDVPSINVSETLENVMERMQIKDRGLLIATENGHIAGIIDIDNIMELLRIQKALQE